MLVVHMMQASPTEVKQALQERHAVELDGAWRTVDRAYMHSLLETALFLSVQQGWSLAALPQADLAEGLQTNGHDARSDSLLLEQSRPSLQLSLPDASYFVPFTTARFQNHCAVDILSRKWLNKTTCFTWLLALNQ